MLYSIASLFTSKTKFDLSGAEVSALQTYKSYESMLLVLVIYFNYLQDHKIEKIQTRVAF